MNRLANEKSPYLLQHAANPVDWYPWGEAAFEAARRENKPVFLSVGYSTCHWCHVMAHESFEDPRVAAVLNEHFISIKVDREERPDVDRIYMSYVQSTTGGGGWPMSVWLLSDRRPFYGGTYFPPAGRWGRPAFADILLELARLWRDDRARVEEAAAGVTEHLAAAAAAAPAPAGVHVPGVTVLDGATRDFLSNFDKRHGGFGGAPKFPRPAELLFLLREHRRTGDRAPLDAVARTLEAMAAGGMRDHVGGGFHRYSVDAEWRVPHFEKMLYDQAQLVLALLECAQATGDRFFAGVADDTLRYVVRDMADPKGGFYSAEDADSRPAGGADTLHASEGAFYIWTRADIERILGLDAPAYCLRYGVEADGNALQDPQGEFTGRNVLYEARSIDEVARELGRSAEDVGLALLGSRGKLFDARGTRPRPQLDDKVLTAWNGLMIAAFARASRVLPAVAGPEPAAQDSSGYLSSARGAATFIRSHMWDPGAGRLLRRYRDGEAAIDAYAEDYACLVFGLLELFQADGDPAWLEWAIALQRRLDSLFWDEDGGGWFSTTGEDATVLLRLKEDYDGAEPAASSIAVLNLIALSHLGALGPDSARRVERTLGLFAPRLSRIPRAVPAMLSALSAWHAGLSEVVIVGPKRAAATLALTAAVNREYQPFAVVVPADPGGAHYGSLTGLLPWVGIQPMVEGRPTAYVCRDFACERPTVEASELADRLGGR